MKLRQRYHLFIYLFFWKLCKHRSTSSKITINFFLQQFKLLIQKVICRISRFGRNSVLAGILSAQWRTTLAHVFTSEGKHLGSENANGCVESCSEGRGEYHACLTREISLYSPSKLSCNRFYYVSNAFTDIFWFLHSFVISKDFFQFYFGFKCSYNLAAKSFDARWSLFHTLEKRTDNSDSRKL